jgi:transcriptional regulator with XRE-family HTH domain
MNDIRTELLADLKDEEFRHAYAWEFVDMILARQIRALRKHRGWTQADLAKKIGTSQPFISAIEDEDYGSLSISTLKDLARAFDVYPVVRFESFATLVTNVDSSSAEELQVPPFDEDPSILTMARQMSRAGDLKDAAGGPARKRRSIASR